MTREKLREILGSNQLVIMSTLNITADDYNRYLDELVDSIYNEMDHIPSIDEKIAYREGFI